MSRSVGRGGLHDSAVCKMNPGGHKKLLCGKRFPMNIKLHVLYSGELEIITFAIFIKIHLVIMLNVRVVSINFRVIYPVFCPILLFHSPAISSIRYVEFPH